MAAAAGNSAHVFAIKGTQTKKEWKESEENEEAGVRGRWTWQPDVAAVTERSLWMSL